MRREQEQEQGVVVVEDVAPVNEVRLRGRLVAPVEERELPSGDVLCTWRLVVDRPPVATPARGRAVSVDALDCTAWTAALRRRARGLAVGDVVEVEGALRRRFWRSGAGAASRTEVEVVAVRRVGRALPRARRRAARDVEAAAEPPGRARAAG